LVDDGEEMETNMFSSADPALPLRKNTSLPLPFTSIQSSGRNSLYPSMVSLNGRKPAWFAGQRGARGAGRGVRRGKRGVLFLLRAGGRDLMGHRVPKGEMRGSVRPTTDEFECTRTRLCCRRGGGVEGTSD
jgi:hypothetical protein